MSNLDSNLSHSLDNMSKNLEKISNTLFLKSLMDYRKSVSDKISEIEASDAKKTILNLCDGTKKITEIAESLGYSSHSGVSNHIKTMIDDKIIFNKKVGNENFPISIDALIEMLLTSSL